MTLLDCGHEASPTGVGYGTDSDGLRHCYDCCAERDRASMRETGKATLYDCGDTLTNWPGTLSLKVTGSTEGRHNIAGTRRNVWFRFEGRDWYGVRYGENTQIVHCRRLKG